MTPLSPSLAATIASPVSEARRWLVAAPADRRVIDVSQGAPAAPPPEPLRAEMARIVMEEPAAHLYGAVLGLPALREAVAERWSLEGSRVAPSQVAITSGCNQAYVTAIATLASPGDNVILPLPWYFNNAMWLTQQGMEPRGLPCGEGLIPDPDAAAELIDARTRAVVLVSPNNPAGVAYPAETLRGFMDLCRARGLALILDETYRDFDARPAPVHDLMADPDWADTLIRLYSFSKAYRLTGHRVGAMIAHEDRLAQAEKVLDCVTICATGLGQRAALWGMRHLEDWLVGERAEVLARERAAREMVGRLPGWSVEGAGAYFAYLRHPFEAPSDAVARDLVAREGVLMLPGTTFGPEGSGRRHLRMAIANLDVPGIGALGARLAAFTEASAALPAGLRA